MKKAMIHNKIKRIIYEELWSWFLFLLNWIPGRIGAYLRGTFLSLFFGKKGLRCKIKENVEIWKPKNLFIGNNCVIGRGNVLNCEGMLYLGNNVEIGPYVSIYTINHTTIISGMKSKLKTVEPVLIGNNVWIGTHSIILPGVTIGDNTIVAAGSVVTHSFGDDNVIAGVPAINIKNKVNNE